MDALAIGVDLGGTKIALALADRAGNVLRRAQLPTLPREGEEAVLDRIASGARALLEAAPAPVAGLGLGSPGQVDSASGQVRQAVNLGWGEVDVRGGLERRLGADLPIFLAKDANAGALGELVYGAARGCADFVYLAVGTGLGGGAVTGGHLVTGATFNPPEIGHLSLDPDARRCVCGQRGCAEIFAAGVGFLAGVAEHRAAFPASPLAALDAPTTVDILAAADAGDALALRVVAEGGWALGAIMGVCAAVLNPALVVVGGGLWHAAERYLRPAAERELRRRVLPASAEPMRIVSSEVRDSALGAAALVWHGLRA